MHTQSNTNKLHPWIQHRIDSLKKEEEKHQKEDRKTHISTFIVLLVFTLISYPFIPVVSILFGIGAVITVGSFVKKTLSQTFNKKGPY